MKKAIFDFSPELQSLLKYELRGKTVIIKFRGAQSVKHLIESLGIPHTEIGELRANGVKTDQGTIVQNNDRIKVWPVDSANLENEPIFVIDGHLGRLASHLRMLGLDCLYNNAYEDDELVEISVEKERILLTRDRLLLMHKVITQGCLLRSLDSNEQLNEVVSRYGLAKWIKPFNRCMRCNHPLEPVEKETVLGKLEPLTKKYFQDFKRCPSCDKVYWKGSHYEQMMKVVTRISNS